MLMEKGVKYFSNFSKKNKKIKYKLYTLHNTLLIYFLTYFWTWTCLICHQLEEGNKMTRWLLDAGKAINAKSTSTSKLLKDQKELVKTQRSKHLLRVMIFGWVTGDFHTWKWTTQTRGISHYSLIYLFTFYNYSKKLLVIYTFIISLFILASTCTCVL